jgi:lactate permease
VCSNYISVELTDIVASLLGRAPSSCCSASGARRAAARRQPRRAGPQPAIAGAATSDPAFEDEVNRRRGGDSTGEVIRAYAPYLIVIAIFGLAQIGFIKEALASATQEIDWPGLDITNADGEEVSTIYNFNWLAAAGTLLLVCGLLTMIVLGMGFGRALKAYVDTSNSSSGRSSQSCRCSRSRTS